LPPVGPQVHARHFRGAPCFPLLIFRPAFLLCSLLVFLRQLRPLGAGSLAAPEWLPSLEFCFPAAVFPALSGLAARVYSAPGPTSLVRFSPALESPALGLHQGCDFAAVLFASRAGFRVSAAHPPSYSQFRSRCVFLSLIGFIKCTWKCL
jgi:hypothetical protein